MLEWLEEYSVVFYWLSGASVAFFIGSLLAVGVVMVRLPADYFGAKSREHRRNTETWQGRHPAARLALRIGKNVLAWLLILAGLAMLVLPGQGMLVIFIGVMLADFPGKYRVERWIISRGRVLKTINRLRDRFGRPPLEMDQQAPKPA